MLLLLLLLFLLLFGLFLSYFIFKLQRTFFYFSSTHYRSALCMVCINKADMKKTGAFQMWIWEEMLKISYLKWWHSWYGTGEEDSAAKDKKKMRLIGLILKQCAVLLTVTEGVVGSRTWKEREERFLNDLIRGGKKDSLKIDKMDCSYQTCWTTIIKHVQ